ncbi:MAG: 23S rRNA (guanosine(2251)-2'-O)-methyltransferase RlmB [Legionella sp. 40-6]|nr:23S rRNA (guanosine(2251)-2'-O)-methyltransferase RlmB [Legionella sp.]OJY58452.1 MAG: 23S rRNA (guanosine(2251)-2'-O)-methyltransferase RlmB [Legionella sp. 40-6]
MSDDLIYGIHAVTAALNNPHRTIKQIYATQERNDQRLVELLSKAEEKSIPVERLSSQVMLQQFGDQRHQGIIARALAMPQYNESHLAALLEASNNPKLILILDGVTDPHNLGACLRTADATGVDFVVIPKDKSASITPVVSKVACGAAEAIPVVRVTNLVRSMEKLKAAGVWIYGAAGEARQSLYTVQGTENIAVVLGAEGDGLRRLTRDHCDALFSLPMQGSVESLNVSVATGVTLYEIVRQRMRLGK